MTIAHHILVPTDFSDAAAEAYPAAALLAQLDRARVTLLHVFDSAPLAVSPSGLGAQSQHLFDRPEVEARIHGELERVGAEHFAGIDVQTRLVLSLDDGDGIVEAAAKEDADLVVMSTHGRTGVAGALIGSVAERVVRHAPCAVLVVRAQPAA